MPTKINFFQTFFNDVPNPNGGKKKVKEKYSEDARHNFHIFKSYAVTATKALTNNMS